MLLTSEDETFLKEWEECELSFDQWTHKSHLRMAFIISLKHFGDKTKIDSRIKSGIQRFNQKHQEKLTVGYHETITCFWINIVYSLVEKHFDENLNFEEFLKLENQLLESRLMFDFYSKEVLFQKDARLEYIKPDLKK
jgi:hypothetical protein